MFTEYLKGIEGVATYPLVSLAIFLPFFIGVVYLVMRMKKSDLDRMSRLPLDHQPDETDHE